MLICSTSLTCHPHLIHINQCPVPEGYNASLVGQRIEEALSELGYSGPVTITAIGNLKHTLKQHPHVLRDLSSTGIHLKHVLKGFDLDCLSIILEDMLAWKRKNPPLVALIFISGGVEDLAFRLGLLQDTGYTILRSYPLKHIQVYDCKILNSPPKSASFPIAAKLAGFAHYANVIAI